MNQTVPTDKKRRGLSETEVLRAREQYGSNQMTPPKRKGFWGHFIENLNDPVIRVLLVALVVNILFVSRRSDWIETVGIALSVFLATFISTVSECGSENAFSRLNAENENYSCRVRRDGLVRILPIGELVVGDIVLLSAGDKIPADGFLVSGSLKVDQSAMTGESREIEKRPHTKDRLSPESLSALLRECSVTEGEGEMEVAVVGDKTFIGEISREILMDTRESPLKLRLTKLASQISRLGYAAAVLVGLVYLFQNIVLESGMDTTVILAKLSDVRYLLATALNAFTLGLTVVVMAVPEGLPTVIAVVLSSNMKKMVKDMALVRKPVGIEAAGSMNILFTDKTGTLTEGTLSVTRFFTDAEEFRTVGDLKRLHAAAFERMNLCARFNTSAELSGNDVVGGNTTEQALLRAFAHERQSVPCHLVDKEPFDSTKKYSHATVSAYGGIRLYKGAPERLLPHVRYSLGADGRKLPFDKIAFQGKMSALTKEGARVIVAAFSTGRSAMSELTLICGIAMADKIRQEAKKSVATLRDAGIQVVMITGDNPDTAQSIAAKCGVLSRTHDLCLTSDQLARLSDARLTELLPQLAVVARALPTDKSRLVRVAQEAGLVCGMTGDGINDAPALRRADIGFSMGSGTQVAKEAGDIIILDNNLASIVKAVLYGRNIFKSIRKFIVFQLTMNLCAVGVSMICPFLGIEAPITVVQMLWINIIMDTLGGLAFAGEPALPSCMKEKPKHRDEPILCAYMVNQILLLGGFTVALSLFFLKSPAITSMFRTGNGDIYLLTAFFAFFIFAGVFNCFGARTDRLNLFAGLGKNRVFSVIMAVILTIQIGFTYLGGSVLRTTPLLPRELATALLAALLVFPAELVRKLIWKFFVKKPRY